MGTVDTTSALTLIELAKRTNNGDIMKIVEVLSKKNAILQDAVWTMANQPTSHKVAQRVSEPTGSFRQINGGVTIEASETKNFVEPICMLEAYSRVDKALVDLAPDQKEFRMTEDLAFLGGLAKSMATALFYGDLSLYPERIQGLSLRTDWDATTDANVVAGGDTGAATTSLWIINWDVTEGAHLIYPKGSETMGITSDDLGVRLIYPTTTSLYEAYVTHFKVWFGLVIREPRAVQRIVNLAPTYGDSKDLDPVSLVKALDKMLSSDKAVIYCNRSVKTVLDIEAMNKSNGFYTIENIFGKQIPAFQGVPVKLCEGITNQETAVA